MKVRRVDADGDMLLGHGSYDFHVDTAEGVAQNVATRLALWRGTWFIDTTEGTPWLQQILGKHDAVDVVLRERILETPGVRDITAFEAIFDPDTRRISVQATIETIYDGETAEVQVNL